MSYFEDFLNAAASTFIEDCSIAIRTATAPIRVPFNELRALIEEWETSSQDRLREGLSRAEVHRRFAAHKNRFSSAPDRDGKYVYYFLCNIEFLPASQKEHWIFKAAAFFDAAPDIAKKQIGKIMHKWVTTGLLNDSNEKQLMICG